MSASVRPVAPNLEALPLLWETGPQMEFFLLPSVLGQVFQKHTVRQEHAGRLCRTPWENPVGRASPGGQLCPPVGAATSGGVRGCHTGVPLAWRGAGGAAQPPQRLGRPTTEDYAVSRVSSAEGQKPRGGGRGTKGKGR